MAKIQKTDKSEKIEGTNKSDVIYAMGGDDTIWAWEGNDTVYAGDGDDLIVLHKGKDHVDGGKGEDLLDFYYATAGITLDLGSGSVIVPVGNANGTTTFEKIEGAYGSKFGDLMTGSALGDKIFSMKGNDTILGLGGDDTINAYIGNDEISGGSGDDTLYAAPGNDTFDGGDDTDLISFYFDKDGVTVSLAAGTAAFESSAGTGVTTFTNVENLAGSLKNDTLTGDAGANQIGGDKGKDKIDGGAGDDILGGALGKDTLTGGADSDGFVFTSFGEKNKDVITDFDVVDDKIAVFRSVFGVGATGTSTDFGDFEIRELVDAQFEANSTGQASTRQTRLIYESDTGILWYDANGSKSGKREIVAELDMDLALTVDNFVVVT